MNPRISEIGLVVVLVAMLGLVRVYYGGGCGLVFVWKGEFSYNDTLVNLDDIMKLPKEVVKEEHPSVYFQMAALDLFEDANPFAYRRRHRLQRQHSQSPVTPEAGPGEETTTPPGKQPDPDAKEAPEPSRSKGT